MGAAALHLVFHRCHHHVWGRERRRRVGGRYPHIPLSLHHCERGRGGERNGGRGEGWREGGGVTVAAPALALNSTT